MCCNSILSPAKCVLSLLLMANGTVTEITEVNNIRGVWKRTVETCRAINFIDQGNSINTNFLSGYYENWNPSHLPSHYKLDEMFLWQFWFFFWSISLCLEEDRSLRMDPVLHLPVHTGKFNMFNVNKIFAQFTFPTKDSITSEYFVISRHRRFIM